MDKCPMCPVEFKRHYVRKGQRQQYCSRRCRFLDGFLIRRCATCGEDYRVHKFHLKRRPYCSLACMQRRPCIACGATIVGRKTFQSGERSFCSRDCAILTNREPSYKVAGFTATIIRLGRLQCERCNEARPEALDVHHRDKNRKNNAPDNLETICGTCHYVHHRRESKALAVAVITAGKRAALAIRPIS